MMQMPGSKEECKDCARMPQADVHHAASRHSALTTSLTSTRARRNPLLTSHPRPQQQEQESIRLAAKFAGCMTKPVGRACEMRNSPKLLRRHARIRSTLLTQPARRQKEAHLLFLVGEPVHTDFVTRNSHGERFRLKKCSLF